MDGLQLDRDLLMINSLPQQTQSVKLFFNVKITDLKYEEFK